MEIFDTEMGVALACFLAFLGYLGLLFEHRKPEKRRKRQRIAHAALVLAASIEFACALGAVMVAHSGRGPLANPPQQIAPPYPVLPDDFARLACGRGCPENDRLPRA
jgi:hypothetical protein